MKVEGIVTGIREGETEFEGKTYPKRWVSIEGLNIEQSVNAEPPREGSYIRAIVKVDWRDSKDGKRRPRYKLTAFRYVDF